MPSVNIRAATAGIPPWMWYWCIMFTLNLPVLFRALYDDYDELNTYFASIDQMRSVDPQGNRLSFLYYPAHFIEQVPQIILVAGLLTILLPRLRASYIQHRNKLILPPPSIPSLAEIENFVREQAPGLEVRVNLTRPGRIWVYPTGYRRATVAVFAGFVLLWKTDREAAKAVLLHELAHYRRGDALFMGPGSFLETTVKLALLSYILFLALPYLLNSIDQIIQSIEWWQKFDATTREFDEIAKSLGLETSPSPTQLPNHATSALLLLWGLLWNSAAFLVKTASWFVLPVACMWAAELNADYLAANQPSYKVALLRELSKKNSNVGWWRSILFRLSHPPGKLRRFFLRHSDSYFFSVMLLLFPLALFVRIAVLHVWVLVTYVGIGPPSAMVGQPTDFTWQNYLLSVVNNTRLAVTSNPVDWALMTVLLIVWTAAARPWERFFETGHESFVQRKGEDVYFPDFAPKIATTGQSSTFKYYAVAAAFTGVVFFVAMVWKE